MDDPQFYRDDLQSYFDLQVASGNDQAEAVRELKKKFKVKNVTITPMGEVRSPGVVDNPNPPDALAAPPEGGEPPPEGEEDEGPGSQIGGEDPHGKDAGRGADESELTLAIDTLWDTYLQTDGNLDEFEAWVADQSWAGRLVEGVLAGWEAPDLLEHWRPSRLPKQRARRFDGVRSLSAVNRDLYERFTRLVNMRSGELRAHLRSHALREMVAQSRRSKRGPLIESRRLARAVLHMKASPVCEWRAEDWSQCRRIVSLIERARRNSTPLLDERGAATRKLFTLRSLGHNPTVRARILESDLIPLLEDRRALHRYIDATPGIGLVELWEDDADADADADAPGTKASAVDFDDLKKGQVDLEPAERDEVLKREATWHHNVKEPKKPTPAVWKAKVGRKTHYVTNTHRLFQVRSTLKGAINAYHRVVKQTA